MRPIAPPSCHPRGFTLIEVIITLVIGAILASMLTAYFGTAITSSSTPLTRMQQALNLQQVVENITADYKTTWNGSQFDLATIKGRIGPEGADQTNNYGTYRVIDNHYLQFVSQAETTDTDPPSDPHPLLKVTVKGGSGETLTVVFSKS